METRIPSLVKTESSHVFEKRANGRKERRMKGRKDAGIDDGYMSPRPSRSSGGLKLVPEQRREKPPPESLRTQQRVNPYRSNQRMPR
ncbi:unnamed protein product [Merluccius merluccius]